MIRAVIRYVEKHLPHHEILVFLRVNYGFIEQPIVPQFCKIIPHALLNAVPALANDTPIVRVGGRQGFRGFDAAEFAEPYFIHAHKMNDLIPDRPVRVARLSRKLFMGKLSDAILP